MQFFPRHGHRSARFKICDSAGNFVVPSLSCGRVRTRKAVEQGVGQCSPFVDGQFEGSFQKIGNLWTHGPILLLAEMHPSGS